MKKDIIIRLLGMKIDFCFRVIRMGVFLCGLGLLVVVGGCFLGVVGGWLSLMWMGAFFWGLGWCFTNLGWLFFFSLFGSGWFSSAECGSAWLACSYSVVSSRFGSL